MLTRTKGLIATVVGVLLALAGLIAWLGMSHQKIGMGLLVIGGIVLAIGVYAS
jgi:hypothetical protein